MKTAILPTAAAFLVVMSLSRSGIADVNTEWAEIEYDQVGYWQELLRNSDLPRLVEEYKAGPEFAWPACTSRSHARGNVQSEKALLHDICRGNALYVLNLLHASYDTIGQLGDRDLWSTLDRLLDFRDRLHGTPSYVSYVLMDAINLYVYVAMMERLYRDWAPEPARGILDRLRAVSLGVEDFAALIADETDHEVLAIAREFAEAKSLSEDPRGGVSFESRHPGTDRAFWLDVGTYLTLMYLADRDTTELPSQWKDVALEVFTVKFEETVRGTLVSSVELLSDRNIAGLMARRWDWDFKVNVKALYFFEYVARVERPVGPIDLESIKNSMTGFDLETPVVTKLRVYKYAGSNISSVYRDLLEGRFEPGRRRYIRGRQRDGG